ncbi:MAG: hypothetical protein OXC91_03685 [Rhodobacteraceae bacterium]|nr:hypothetical protein [Paracoccaceae bacterium]
MRVCIVAGLRGIARIPRGDTTDLLVLPDLSRELCDPSGIHGRQRAAHPVLDMLRDGRIACRCTVIIPAIRMIDAGGKHAMCMLALDASGAIIGQHVLMCGLSDEGVSGQSGHGSQYELNKKPLIVVDAPAGRIGLCSGHGLASAMHCRLTAQTGAEILVLAGAGRWPESGEQRSVLNRARAIETGAYVIAPAGGGIDQEIMLVDPWGRVLGRVSDDVETVVFDLALVRGARCRLPALEHDRPFQLMNDSV